MADLTSSTSGIKPMIFNAGTTLGATSFDDYIFSIKSTCAMKSKKHAQIFDEDVDDYTIDEEANSWVYFLLSTTTREHIIKCMGP